MPRAKASGAKRTGSRRATPRRTTPARAGTLKVGDTTTGFSPKAGRKVGFKVKSIGRAKNGRKIAKGTDASGNKVNRFI